ncbi:MAG TPA: hypothetical protein VIT38_07565 [Allosphingosinicella sp.]
MQVAPQRCEDSEQRNGSEICAQWEAANAARQSAEIARDTLSWNIGAFFALFLTLGATAWSAFAASKAAKAAEKSTELLDDTAKRQLRAYVITKCVTVDGVRAGRTPHFTCCLRNVGQTPAYDLRVIARTYSISSEEAQNYRTAFERAAGPVSSTVLGPGEGTEICVLADEALDKAGSAAVRSGENIIGVFGVASYRDIFKRRHLVTFKQFVHAPWVEPSGKCILALSDEGNCAN